MSTAAHDLLASYGQANGLASLQFNKQGCARLMFEDEVAVDLEVDESAGCIQLYSVLGPVPAGEREMLYRRLLEGNLFGQQTVGAALAVDAVREEVLICRQVEFSSATAATLAATLEAFAGAARQWQRQYDGGALSATRVVDGASSQSPQWQSHFMRG